MVVDIRTLILVLFIILSIQSLVLFFTSVIVKGQRGIKCWGIGILLIALGFVCMFLRTYKEIEVITIILGNLSHFAGFIFLYVGSQHFFNHEKKIMPLIVASLVFLLVISYYTIIKDQVNTRAILYSFLASALLLVNGVFLLKERHPEVRKSVAFVSVIFLIGSAFLFVRFFYLLFFNPIHNFFNGDFFQMPSFIGAMLIGLMLTFGFILVINQRLNAQVTTTAQHFKLIFNTIPDIATVTEVKSGKFVYVNDEFFHVTGHSRKEVEGRSVFDVSLWKNPNDRQKLICQLKEKSPMITQEFEFLRKDKNELIGLVSANPIVIGDKECVLFIIRDITDLKKKESDLAQKTLELEKSNAEKDTFFSILAHDLRGTFGSILNLSEVLSDQSFIISEEEKEKMIMSLHRNAMSTNELLNNLLNWAAIRRKRFSYQPVECTFFEAVGETLPTLYDAAVNKQISLVNNIPDEIIVYADRYMFQTIIRNLILNAIKFTYPGGRVEVALLNENDDMLQFIVSDNGIGMSALMAESIFKSDQKTSRQGTLGEPSSGLGLILCKEFVELHQGQIHVDSEEGKGSRFIFSLSKKQV